MSARCEPLLNEVGAGVSASLRAVDCVASDFSAQAFGRLFAPGGGMVASLTILLTLFVAFFAIQLLTGRSSIGVRSLTPRMMTLGLVLTFATSWFAYQAVVWNLAVAAPDWLATLLTGSRGSATQGFGDKIDVVFAAVQAASGTSTDISAFSPPGLMWLGATLLLLGTVGVLVTARIALAVLVALGPIFVVMALFDGTRGLFAGWVKGLVMLALTPLFAVLGGSIMLEMAVPVLSGLAQTPGQLNPQAAMAFFLIGAVHAALMVMVLKVTGAMIAGWSVFGLARTSDAERGRSVAALPPPATAQATPAAAAASTQTPAAAAALASAGIAAARRLDIAAVPVGVPANDTGAAAAAHTGNRTVVHAVSPFAARNTDGPQLNRAHGIGNRFRPANSRPAGIRETEKLK